MSLLIIILILNYYFNSKESLLLWKCDFPVKLFLPEQRHPRGTKYRCLCKVALSVKALTCIPMRTIFHDNLIFLDNE